MPRAYTCSSPLIPILILLISVPPLIFFIGPRFIPVGRISISLPDELDDLSLFHKAIAMDSASYPRRTPRLPSAKSHLSASLRRPKIAFLFLMDTPLHLAPLWERFFSNVTFRLYNIYVHADPTVKITLSGVFEGKIIPSKRTQSSSPTLVSAARRLLATAILDDPSNAYFALVSQYCIPLHSFNYLYNFLFDLGRLSMKLEFSSYIEIQDKESTLLWDRYNARGEGVMLPEIPFDEFRIGSQFFVLIRKHALIAISDTNLWRKFKMPCIKEAVCFPEEHYLPTLLSMQDPNACTHFTLTTSSTFGIPYTYHPPEISPELIHKLRESNSSYSYMFARKFSLNA